MSPTALFLFFFFLEKCSKYISRLAVGGLGLSTPKEEEQEQEEKEQEMHL